MQRELTAPGPLLAPDGTVATPGWARQPLLTYDRKQARGRVKEWDYYCVMDQDHGLALTVADMGYLGIIAVHWLDFSQGQVHVADVMRPFTWGRMGFPPSSTAGDVVVQWGKRSLRFLHRPGERELIVDWPGFRGGQDLSATVLLRGDEDEDSIVVATPFSQHRTAFYYNHKVNCLLAEGELRVGDRRIAFRPDRAMGVLDWGRGVWPYSNAWYWGSASGWQDGHRVGLNLGEGFGDLSTHTENIAFVDGVGHKLEGVSFHVDGWLDPWRFTSSDGRLEATFQPRLERAQDVNLRVFRSMQHQVFGHYSGRVVLDDGSTLVLDRLPGFAEEVINRW